MAGNRCVNSLLRSPPAKRPGDRLVAQDRDVTGGGVCGGAQLSATGEKAGRQPLRAQWSAEEVVRRKQNEFVKMDVDSTPPLKDEIREQYSEAPSEGFEGLWAGSFLKKIDDRQRKGGRPQSSHALLAQLGADDRSQNNDVRVHGWVGSLEASLRKNAEGTAFIKMKQATALEKGKAKEPKPSVPVAEPTSEVPSMAQKKEAVPSTAKANKVATEPPYDGGHLVAFQFMGPSANTYTNVAPQGKALNNGPFQNWEKKVVGVALKQTEETLTSAGVKKTDLPHTFDYLVSVDYPSSMYNVSPAALAEHGLIPGPDIGRLPETVTLTKRIPVAWRAYAQPLAFPSAAEMGVPRRPDTPFMFASTHDYGLVDKSNKERTNQEFMARGPADIVSQFADNTAAELDFAAGLAKNKSKTTFNKLVGWAAQGDDVDLDEVAIWARTPFVDKVDLSKAKQIARKYMADVNVVDSEWVDSGRGGGNGTYTPKQMGDELRAVAADSNRDGKLAERYLDNVNKIASFLASAKKTEKTAPSKPAARPGSKSTKIDFSGTMDLEGGMLQDVNRFQFSAAETQPD